MSYTYKFLSPRGKGHLPHALSKAPPVGSRTFPAGRQKRYRVIQYYNCCKARGTGSRTNTWSFRHALSDHGSRAGLGGKAEGTKFSREHFGHPPGTACREDSWRKTARQMSRDNDTMFRKRSVPVRRGLIFYRVWAHWFQV